ncbi:putative defense protein 3 [Liolophura sinensis]|uniref:putative defense protein 3 n=1 Tax=Liolophura sinensis TaxID=3198878 RepID=UPI0031598E90
MATNNIVGLLAIIGCLAGVKAYPNGPPVTVCTTMTPSQQSHGTAQNTASPYTVTTNKPTYMPGETITVTLTSPANSNFKGVFVQARLKNGQNTEPQGTFMLNDGETELKLMTCANRANSAVSHNSRVLKTTKTLKWKAPDTNVGDVRFMVTFVRETRIFWEGVMSADVKGMDAVTQNAVTQDAGTTTMKPGNGSSTVNIQGVLIVALVAATGFLQMIL